jgi:hypothetical protein
MQPLEPLEPIFVGTCVIPEKPLGSENIHNYTAAVGRGKGPLLGRKRTVGSTFPDRFSKLSLA